MLSDERFLLLMVPVALVATGALAIVGWWLDRRQPPGDASA